MAKDAKEAKKTEKVEKPAVEEEKVEEKVEKKKEKKKKVEKKKRKRRSLFSHYKIEGDSFKRSLPFCERCGIGYFMADHGDRYTCGHCGFTRYKPTGAEE